MTTTPRTVVLPTLTGHVEVELLDWDAPPVARRLVNWLKAERHTDLRLADVIDVYLDGPADLVVIRTTGGHRHRIPVHPARQLRREASIEAAGR